MHSLPSRLNKSLRDIIYITAYHQRCLSDVQDQQLFNFSSRNLLGNCERLLLKMHCHNLVNDEETWYSWKAEWQGQIRKVETEPETSVL